MTRPPLESPRNSVDAVVVAAAWMAFAQLCFGVMNVTARLGSTDVPWQEVGASRFLFGAIVSLVVARARGGSLRVFARREMWTRTLWGTLSALGTFYTLASLRISLGDAITLMSTGPIFIALLSWPLLGERVSARVVVAIAISLVGIVAVVKPSFHVAGLEGVTAVCVAFFSSMAMISLRRLGTRESSEAVVFHFSAFAALAMLALAVPVWKTPGPRAALLLVATGVMGGLAQLAMTRAYSLGRAARVSVLGYLGVVFTRLFALPAFGEVPSPTQIAGSLLIIASGAALLLGGGATVASARR